MFRRRSRSFATNLRIVGLLVAIASSAGAQQLRLPFDGRWFVFQGGDTPNVNDHTTVPAQRYALDFMKVGDPEQRGLSRSDPRRLEDYYSWGAPVLAPADGDIVDLVDTLPDNELGVKDANRPLGNHVTLRVAPDRYVFLAHFQRRSVAVKLGAHVKRGDLLGRCGNSGNTDFPHIHMHIQDTPTFNAGTGQNPQFAGINVELSGKRFDHVDWPLIRGLFVSNP
jgi:hypothetical protein